MQFLKKDSVEFDMTFIFKGKSFKLLATLKIRTYHGFGKLWCIILFSHKI